VRRFVAPASRPPHGRPAPRSPRGARATRAARGPALLAAAALALGAAGCGSSGRSTEANLRLQREDLIAASRALAEAQREVAAEIRTTRSAWPSVANGLPSPASAAQSRAIAAAEAGAAAVRLPKLFGEERAAGLTGPGASLAGTFRSFAGLSATGWKMISHALAVDRAGGAAASFARANSPLYIESVYDGHFGLSQIGKKLTAGYAKLGGPAAFGHALSQAEVEALAASYSEAAARLHPHPGVKLGS
jgi:hypothetical protein